MVKYLAFYEKEFYEFKTFRELEFFKSTRSKLRYKKITSKKAETEFRRDCIENPDINSKVYIVITKDNDIECLDKWSSVQDLINKGVCKYQKSFKNRDEAQKWINNSTRSVYKESSLVCETKGDKIFLIKDGENIKITNLANKNFNTELTGIIETIKFAIKKKEEQILIKSFCEGAKNWANGVWTTKKPYQKEYKEEIESLRKQINIDFY